MYFFNPQKWTKLWQAKSIVQIVLLSLFFFQFLFYQCSPKWIIVVEFMLLGVNMFWVLIRAHFNAPLAAQAKMRLSQAQNIFTWEHKLLFYYTVHFKVLHLSKIQCFHLGFWIKLPLKFCSVGALLTDNHCNFFLKRLPSHRSYSTIQQINQCPAKWHWQTLLLFDAFFPSFSSASQINYLLLPLALRITDLLATGKSRYFSQPSLNNINNNYC